MLLAHVKHVARFARLTVQLTVSVRAMICLESELDYIMCEHCFHFIDANDVTGEGIAEYIHLDNGVKEHDHDAVPGSNPRSLDQWREFAPELFTEYSDGEIGPNSEHFPGFI